MRESLDFIKMQKDKIENKTLKIASQNKGLVSPHDADCPYVILTPFASQGIGFGSHLSVDVELLEKAIAEEDLINRGFVKLKEN
jgi:hypothetical protein